MNGLDRLNSYKEAGFSDEELGNWTVQKSKELSDAGFGMDEISTYFGQPPFDPKPVQEHVNETMTAATKPATEGGQPKPVTSFQDALKAGYGESFLGLLGGKPTTTVSPDAPMASRIAGNIGTLAGDIPSLTTGFLAGGGPASPVTGLAGAVAAQQGFRKILMDKYAKGEVTGWPDFWDRFSGAFIESMKGWVTGAATGLAGKAIGLAPIASGPTKIAAQTAGEIATMVTVGKALEGQVPEPQDFIDTALTLGFVKGAGKVATKLRDIYTQTGLKPSDVAQDIQKDPTILHDLASDHAEIPKTYRGYHGTFSDFTEFDPSKSGTGTFGKGIYFTTDPKHAGTYAMGEGGRIIPADLSLKKTLDLDAPASEELRAQVRSLLKPELENYDQLVEDTKTATTNMRLWSVLDDAGASTNRDTNAVLKQLGYDSLKHGNPAVDGRTDYVVFDKTAIKPAYRDNPTVEDIHAQADASGIKWDNTPAFMDLTEALTGKRHLDELTPRERETVANALAEWEPTHAMGGGAPGRSAAQVKPLGEAQKAILDRFMLKDPETAGMTLSDAYTSVVDNLNPIKQALKAGGKDSLDVAVNPYSLERLTRGIAGKASQFLNHGAFDFETYKTQTRGYFKILDPIKNDLDGFRAYMVAKRAIEKDKQGIDTGVPIEDAKQVVKEGAAKYEAIHQERIQYRNALLDTMYKSGILSKESLSAMKEANKDYVPFYRFFEDETGRPITASSVRNPIKQMKGSERQILDPIISDIKDTFLFVALAEKNAARQAFVALGPEFSEKQKQPMQVTHLKEEEIRKLFDEFVTVSKQTKRSQDSQTKTTTTGGVAGQEPPGKALQLVTERVKEALKARGFSTGETDQMVSRIASGGKGGDHTTVETVIREVERTSYVPELDIRLPNEAADIFRAMQRPARADEIAVYDKGHRDLYKVDPKVAEAFNGLDAGPASLLAKIAYTPASLLRAGVTITPDFIARNLMRDAISSFIYAGSNPLKTAKGLVSIVKEDTAYQNWMKGGGANATMVAIDRDYLSKQLGQLDLETGLMKRAWNIAKTPLDILRATSELAENATRIGAVRKGMTEAETKAQIQALSLIARESTVDFARHGRDTEVYAKSTAFFNPAIQGIDRFAREMKANPLGTTAKAFAAVTLPSMLLWYANRNDEEIQNLPRWQKDLFWVSRVPLPDGGSFIMRVPKPQEFGILFGTVPERLLDAYVAENPSAMRDIEKTIIGAFTPSFVPTSAIPVISQFANRDLFMGRPLIPAGQEKLLPAYQYTPYTTELAKAMGQIIGAFPGVESAAVRSDEPFIGGTARALTTPILIENYVRSWTGGMGYYLMQLADKALREAGALPDPVKPAGSLSDVPFVKAFTVRYPSASAQSIVDFHADYDASKKYYDTMMHLAKEGDPRAIDLIQAHTEDLAQLSGIRDTLTQQSQIIHMIDKNPQMTADDKQQLIDTLYYSMIEISKGGNTILRALKDAQK